MNRIEFTDKIKWKNNIMIINRTGLRTLILKVSKVEISSNCGFRNNKSGKGQEGGKYMRLSIQNMRSIEGKGVEVTEEMENFSLALLELQKQHKERKEIY